MKKTFIKFALLNVAIGVFILIAFYLSAFLSGYGSNNSYLSQERKLFITFLIFHVIISMFLLYKYRQINWMATLTSSLVIMLLYLIAAWKFGYFG